MVLSGTDAACMAPVRRAAEILYAHGATHVWVFGSRGGGRGEWDYRSDVDVAVAGLAGAPLQRAIGAVHGSVGGTVDVVPLEGASPYIRWSLARERVLLPRANGRAPDMTVPRASRVRPLNDLRQQAVGEAVIAASARSVIDFGCGSAGLLERLATAGLERLTGVDRSAGALRAARTRLARTLAPETSRRVRLIEDLIVRRNPLYRDHEVVTAVEVIEHLDVGPRAAFEAVAFGYVDASTVIVTTPNREYNVVARLGLANGLRHPEHRFEWTRDDFAAWSASVAGRYGYTVRLRAIGAAHPVHGAPTQLALFSR